jgi:hypothetical protein
VAGQHERQRVLPVRSPDSARRLRPEAEAARLLAVADRLPVRDRREREPAAALELRAVEVEPQVELHEVAREVRVELSGGLVEHSAAAVELEPGRRPANIAQASLGADEAESADRGLNCEGGHAVQCCSRSRA